jgi:hypothetical protein
MGTLPVNAFLALGEEPYVVDTGMLIEGEAYLAAIEQVIDPAELRWIFLTHDDADHIGGLHALLERAPEARLVTNFLGVGKLGLSRAVPPHRVRLMNVGERLVVGARTLTATRPPLYDAPETMAFHDSELDALFCADCFGCPLESIPELANAIPEDDLFENQMIWASADSPWIHSVDRERFDRGFDEFARNAPEWILSAHLPPAHEMAGRLCANLRRAPDHIPFVGPDQSGLEALIAGTPPY